MTAQRSRRRHDQNAVLIITNGDELVLLHEIVRKQIEQSLVDLQHIDFHARHAVIFAQCLKLGVLGDHLLGQQIIAHRQLQALAFLKNLFRILAADQMLVYVKL